MVPRQLAAGAIALAALALALPASAHAANARVAIGDFRWSKPEIDLDLGEHVTWYWVGPDTMHSVTGTSANAAGLDSDPGNPAPDHDIGDSFRLDFDQPGTFTFQCKLHAAVRGTVVVSSTPGDPVSEPDPIPQSHVDDQPPKLTDVRLTKPSFRRSGGAILDATLNEAASVDADVWRLGHGNRARRRYAGWSEWQGHIGYNHLRFGAGGHLRLRPGRYRAEVRAEDAAHNTSRPAQLRFRVR